MNLNPFRTIRDIAASRFLRRPFYVHISPTRRCNLACRMCNVWRYGNRDEELPIERWREIVAILKREGAAHVVITGGEPLLYDDVLQLVRSIGDAGIDVRLQSNAGAHVTAEKLFALHEAGLRNVTLSLDSLDPAVHDDISRCPGLQAHVIDAIKNAADIFRDGMVVVQTVVSSRNIAELPEIASFATRVGAFSSLVPLHCARGEGEPLRGGDDSFGACHPQVVSAVYDRLRKMKRDGCHIAHSDRFLEASRRYLLTGDCRWRCDAGELYFSILPDGSISLCDDFTPQHNILDGSFSFAAFRDSARARRRSCQGCIWGCWREASYLITRTGTTLDWAKTYMRWRRRP
jgi:MoaA/NifB/PqqE/SkfB family radical SAM enzyme